MHTGFDVFTADISHSLFIEASAGTGKTFTIEHLFLRLLLRKDNPLTIDQILVVTFTQAAAKELRVRIRHRLEKALLEAGSIETYWRLQNALFCFDEAKVLTIHAFCGRVLMENRWEMGSSFDDQTGMIPYDLIAKVIKDHFRLCRQQGELTDAQIEILLKKFGPTFDLFERKVYQTLMQPQSIEKGFSLPQKIEKPFQYDSEKLYEDFKSLAPNYKQLKEDDFEKAKRFCEREEWTLDPLIRDGIPFCTCFTTEKEKVKNQLSTVQLNYPNVLRVLAPLHQLITTLRDPLSIFATFTASCQKLLKRYLEREEIFSYDQWLKQMLKAVEYPQIVQRLRQEFRAAIIDEFQDTDADQWEIFRKVFLPHCPLYLVGDPKQSIYAFRSADLYTFLDAAEALGEQAKRTLRVNYRSSIPLVDKLNALFQNKECFFLPKRQQYLSYYPSQGVHEGDAEALIWMPFMLPEKKTARQVSQKDFDTLEKEQILPAIAKEILSLNEQNIALLVRDRFQAKQAKEILLQYGIQTQLQRTGTLHDSQARPALLSLIQAALNPRDHSAIKVVLACPLVNYSFDRLQNLSEAVIETVYCLHRTLIHRGCSQLVTHFLRTDLATSLINRTDLYRDLIQLSDLLASVPVENLVDVMDRLEEWLPVGDERAEVQQDPMQAGVKIMTIHYSKGLEFDVVFALGLIKRTPLREQLIPHEGKLIAPINYPEAQQLFLQECEAEKMRQFYVAVTRAKKRLYLPHISTPGRKPPPLGVASPMELLHPECPSKSFTPSAPIQHSEKPIKLHPPKSIQLEQRPFSIESFTSLMQKQESILTETPPHDLHAEEKSAHTLPAGAATGELIHSLIEKLPWGEEIHPWIDRELASTSFSHWSLIISEMLCDVFTTPLPHLNVPLQAIDPKQVIREMDFMHLLPDAPGYLKGSIDCIFSHQGVSYIVDWKTNWLGTSAAAYHPQALVQAMQTNQYPLQASIYTQAWKRYLTAINSHEAFGGVFYLFIRGPGIHFIPPEEIDPC
ncbi:MAG: UvrD-helicase domain-containing protein [Chlamydiia bacterium]|nr:UvrD-helicase domain-containing protein [Chlamydiia bacterium]